MSKPSADEQYYRALAPLTIPNAEGAVPSSIKIRLGGIFALDGDEPVNVELLLQSGAARKIRYDAKSNTYSDEPLEPALVVTEGGYEKRPSGVLIPRGTQTAEAPARFRPKTQRKAAK